MQFSYKKKSCNKSSKIMGFRDICKNIHKINGLEKVNGNLKNNFNSKINGCNNLRLITTMSSIRVTKKTTLSTFWSPISIVNGRIGSYILCTTSIPWVLIPFYELKKTLHGAKCNELEGCETTVIVLDA